MVDLLITGINRSGTSVMSNLLAITSGRSILDDPEWAISSPSGCLNYRESKDIWHEVGSTSLLKCPRMCEQLPTFLRDFPSVRVLVMIRDPRDVWASISEKVGLGRPTRMLRNERFGKYSNPLDGFLLQAEHYYDVVLRTQAVNPGRIIIVAYESLYADIFGTISIVLRELGWDKVRNPTAQEMGRQWGPIGHKADPNSIGGIDRWRGVVNEDAARTIWDRLSSAHLRVLELRLGSSGAIVDACHEHQLQMTSFGGEL